MALARNLSESLCNVRPAGSILFQTIINLSLGPGSEVMDFVISWKETSNSVHISLLSSVLICCNQESPAWELCGCQLGCLLKETGREVGSHYGSEAELGSYVQTAAK
jgi:hypothetical protein